MKQDKLKILDLNNKPIFDQEMKDEINANSKNASSADLHNKSAASLGSKKPFNASKKSSQCGDSESEEPTLLITGDARNDVDIEKVLAKQKTRLVIFLIF